MNSFKVDKTAQHWLVELLKEKSLPSDLHVILELDIENPITRLHALRSLGCFDE